MSNGWRATWHKGDIAVYRPSVKVKAKTKFGKHNDDPGWKVCFHCDGTDFIIPMLFARKRDAEAAASAIDDLAVWPNDVDGVAIIAADIGHAEIRRAMLERMAW